MPDHRAGAPLFERAPRSIDIGIEHLVSGGGDDSGSAQDSAISSHPILFLIGESA